MGVDWVSGIWKTIGGLLILLFFVYGIFYFTGTTTSSDDVFECKGLASLVTSVHEIPESISSPGRPAIFCDVETGGFFLKRFDHVRIYGIIEKGQQDSIIQSLQGASAHRRSKQVVVEFYEKENWRTWSDTATGNKGGERGPETAIRMTVLR
jgi:hypothetical protein